VIVVNWNAGDLLDSCLSSLSAADWTGVQLRRVVIVDNASSDDSLTAAEQSPLPIAVIRNRQNLGFGAAANQGAAGSSADYILFLNPDTRVTPDAIGAAAKLLALEPRAGICGVKMKNLAGVTSRGCARFPRPLHFLTKALGFDRFLPGRFTDFFMREWDHETSRWVDHVIGAFYLVRRALFEQLSGFDERFFVYLEDLDFSLRAREAGWLSYYLADVEIMHVEGGTSQQIKAQRLSYSLRSRLLYARKHFSGTGSAFVAAVTLVLEPVTRLAALAIGRNATGMRDTLRAYILLFRERGRRS
jgi:N-acetylglucosaminyl-diphospho-decaprenol L-rhamnosyltransferase